MPFTLSHPAAILPLRKALGGRLPFYALIMGSISPDLGYFFGFGSYFTDNSHTFYRSFTFCLPMGIVLLLFFSLLKNGLFLLLPKALRLLGSALDHPNQWKLSNLPFTILAILVGAWIHIFWDSWTHYDGFVVERLEILKWQIVNDIPIHRILQHASTLGGAIFILLFVRSECEHRKIEVNWREARFWAFWIGSFCVSLGFTVFTLTTDWNYWLAFNDRRLPFLFVVSFTRNFFVFIAFIAFLLTLQLKFFGGLKSEGK